MQSFKIYKHYKGGLYTVLVERAMHTETTEDMVVYSCNVSGQVFCRPYDMFHETIKTETYDGPRFIQVPYINEKMKRKEAVVFNV